MIEYKEIQVFETSRDIIMFGVPNNADATAMQQLLYTVMVEAKRSMFTNNPDKYPRMIYGRPLPEFTVLKDFVKNTPFEPRDEDEDLPAWAKQALHLELPREHQEFVTEVMLFMMDSGKWKRLFGTFTWIAINPGFNASSTDSNTLGVMVERHSAVMRNIGKVTLKGLLLPDKEMELLLLPDKNGEERKPVQRTIRDIMMNVKVNGLSLWQAIVPNNDGGWDGYYTAGKGCDEHKSKAAEYAGCTSGSVMYYCLDRGVDEESMYTLMRKAFTSKAVKECRDCSRIGGKVVPRTSAAAHMVLGKMENSWLDLGRGMSRKKRLEYEQKKRDEAAYVEGMVDPEDGAGDPDAFNFSDDITTKDVQPRDANSVAYTATDTATMGNTAYHVEEGGQGGDSDTDEFWKDSEEESDEEDDESVVEEVEFENMEKVFEDERMRSNVRDEPYEEEEEEEDEEEMGQLGFHVDQVVAYQLNPGVWVRAKVVQVDHDDSNLAYYTISVR